MCREFCPLYFTIHTYLVYFLLCIAKWMNYVFTFFLIKLYRHMYIVLYSDSYTVYTVIKMSEVTPKSFITQLTNLNPV